MGTDSVLCPRCCLPRLPLDTETPDCFELQEFIWQQISQLLGSKMLGGDIGLSGWEGT
jgi:hypothetical protein